MLGIIQLDSCDDGIGAESVLAKDVDAIGFEQTRVDKEINLRIRMGDLRDKLAQPDALEVVRDETNMVGGQQAQRNHLHSEPGVRFRQWRSGFTCHQVHQWLDLAFDCCRNGFVWFELKSRISTKYVVLRLTPFGGRP